MTHADQSVIAFRNGINNSGDAMELIREAMDSFENQMDDYQGDYNYRGWASYYMPRISEWGNEPAYYYKLENKLSKADDNDDTIRLSDGDVCCCLPSGKGFPYSRARSHGYGHTSDNNPHYINGKRIYLCSALELPFGPRDDNKWTTSQFIMHEIAHCFSVNHFHGQFNVKDNERFNTTPMATGYACVENAGDRCSSRQLPSNPDTCWASCGTTLDQYDRTDTWCTGRGNECEDQTWCNGPNCSDPDFCRHTEFMTGSCTNPAESTKGLISANTPLPLDKHR